MKYLSVLFSVVFAAVVLAPFHTASAQSNGASASSGEKYSLAAQLGDPQANNVDPKHFNKNVGGGPGNSGPGDKNPPGNDPGGKPPGNPAFGPSGKK